MIRSLLTVLLVILLGLLLIVQGKQPHILFIVADDYGWNDIGYVLFSPSFLLVPISSFLLLLIKTQTHIVIKDSGW